MDLDIVSSPGIPGKPVIVLIHGLGMDKNIWVALSKPVSSVACSA